MGCNIYPVSKRERNTTFRFKQFEIVQDDNVHKVGTDGILLGAWADITGCKSILDVGTGTGLIALMIAQRAGADVSITAIEPASTPFALAQQNITNSSQGKRIDLQNTSLQDFNSPKPFDLIISNPPYFENSLKPPSEKRTYERHADSLPFNDLLDSVKNLLAPTGRLAVVLPVAEGNRFISLAYAAGIYVSNQCAVFSKESKPQERWLLEFSLTPNRNLKRQSLTLMNDVGDWTPEYKALTGEFYLHVQ